MSSACAARAPAAMQGQAAHGRLHGHNPCALESLHEWLIPDLPAAFLRVHCLQRQLIQAHAGAGGMPQLRPQPLAAPQGLPAQPRSAAARGCVAAQALTGAGGRAPCMAWVGCRRHAGVVNQVGWLADGQRCGTAVIRHPGECCSRAVQPSRHAALTSRSGSGDLNSVRVGRWKFSHWQQLLLGHALLKPLGAHPVQLLFSLRCCCSYSCRCFAGRWRRCMPHWSAAAAGRLGAARLQLRRQGGDASVPHNNMGDAGCLGILQIIAHITAAAQ